VDAKIRRPIDQECFHCSDLGHLVRHKTAAISAALVGSKSDQQFDYLGAATAMVSVMQESVAECVLYAEQVIQ
jgi:hypothetical protein